MLMRDLKMFEFYLDTFSKTKLYIMTHNLNSIYFGKINWLKDVVS